MIQYSLKMLMSAGCIFLTNHSRHLNIMVLEDLENHFLFFIRSL